MRKILLLRIMPHLAFLLSLTICTHCFAEYRAWDPVSGYVYGEFVKTEGKDSSMVVVIKRTDGYIDKIPMAQLPEKDKQYVTKLLSKQKAEEERKKAEAERRSAAINEKKEKLQPVRLPPIQEQDRDPEIIRRMPAEPVPSLPETKPIANPEVKPITTRKPVQHKRQNSGHVAFGIFIGLPIVIIFTILGAIDWRKTKAKVKDNKLGHKRKTMGLFKPKIDLITYWEKKTEYLFSDKWIEFAQFWKQHSPSGCNNIPFEDFTLHFRAVSLQIIGIVISRSRVSRDRRYDLAMQQDSHIRTLDPQQGAMLLRVYGKYNSAFGSSFSDGVRPMAHLFASSLNENDEGKTEEFFYDTFYAMIKEMLTELKPYKLK
ncbi:hypothetical protein ACFLS1_01430 [Verrucomicrobiota bacterium]